MKGGENMAVVSTKLSSTLVIKVKTGTNANGEDTTRNISLRRVKPQAIDEDVFAVGTGVATILRQPLKGIMRQDLNQMASE